ncbi:MAG: VPLPA-CTERM sorting domain-containing protein [Pseudomonadota bacterium]
MTATVGEVVEFTLTYDNFEPPGTYRIAAQTLKPRTTGGTVTADSRGQELTAKGGSLTFGVLFDTVGTFTVTTANSFRVNILETVVVGTEIKWCPTLTQPFRQCAFDIVEEQYTYRFTERVSSSASITIVEPAPAPTPDLTPVPLPASGLLLLGALGGLALRARSLKSRR